MYKMTYHDLYDESYDQKLYAYCAKKGEEPVPLDSCISGLIEELYNSEGLNKEKIARYLSYLVAEIHPLMKDEEYFEEKDINVNYKEPSSWEESFSAWLDCIDQITGELNYRKLCDTDSGFLKKEIVKFTRIYDALDALTYQLTTNVTFDDNILSGALIFLAAKYGVNFSDAVNFKSNATRP